MVFSQVFWQRMPALSAAIMSTLALSFSLWGGMTCDFIRVVSFPYALTIIRDYVDDVNAGQNMPSSSGVLDESIYENVYFHSIGVYCYSELYDIDAMWKVSRIFLGLSYTTGFATIFIGWAISFAVPPNGRNWKCLSLISASTAVLQIPVFLLFDSNPCTIDTNHTCQIRLGSFLLVCSSVLYVAITILTEWFDPPRWAFEANAWKVEHNRDRSSKFNNFLSMTTVVNGGISWIENVRKKRGFVRMSSDEQGYDDFPHIDWDDDDDDDDDDETRSYFQFQQNSYRVHRNLKKNRGEEYDLEQGHYDADYDDDILFNVKNNRYSSNLSYADTYEDTLSFPSSKSSSPTGYEKRRRSRSRRRSISSGESHNNLPSIQSIPEEDNQSGEQIIDIAYFSDNPRSRNNKKNSTSRSKRHSSLEPKRTFPKQSRSSQYNLDLIKETLTSPPVLDKAHSKKIQRIRDRVHSNTTMPDINEISRALREEKMRAKQATRSSPPMIVTITIPKKEKAQTMNSNYQSNSIADEITQSPKITIPIKERAQTVNSNYQSNSIADEKTQSSKSLENEPSKPHIDNNVDSTTQKMTSNRINKDHSEQEEIESELQLKNDDKTMNNQKMKEKNLIENPKSEENESETYDHCSESKPTSTSSPQSILIVPTPIVVTPEKEKEPETAVLSSPLLTDFSGKKDDVFNPITREIESDVKNQSLTQFNNSDIVNSQEQMISIKSKSFLNSDNLPRNDSYSSLSTSLPQARELRVKRLRSRSMKKSSNARDVINMEKIDPLRTKSGNEVYYGASTDDDRANLLPPNQVNLKPKKFVNKKNYVWTDDSMDEEDDDKLKRNRSLHRSKPLVIDDILDDSNGSEIARISPNDQSLSNYNRTYPAPKLSHSISPISPVVLNLSDEHLSERKKSQTMLEFSSQTDSSKDDIEFNKAMMNRKRRMRRRLRQKTQKRNISLKNLSDPILTQTKEPTLPDGKGEDLYLRTDHSSLMEQAVRRQQSKPVSHSDVTSLTKNISPKLISKALDLHVPIPI